MSKPKSKRGGLRDGAGRKPIGDKNLVRHNVMLGQADIEQARIVGKGSISAGIRLALLTYAQK